jgi:flagellar M-ring protein FliF
MKEALVQYKNKGLELWRSLSRTTKMVLIAIVIALILAIIFFIIASKPDYVPLYSNLSADETGQIKEELDKEGVPSKISDNGTTISVPKDQVDTLKVKLAAEGIPKSGQIDYSFFGKNASWGMTDKEFDVLKQEAMQTELSRLISEISGVKDAKVMISLPKDSVWVTDKADSASASVVLNLDPGYQLKPDQVQALYHLVSKSVPNLSPDNIVIMDQMFNYYDPVDQDPGNSALAAYEQQSKVKKDIEEDLQQRVQRMLGMMIGMDKVVVSVTTDIDFTKKNTDEKLVRPVDKKKMKGLQVSAEKIHETYSGDTNNAGGIVGTGKDDVPGYVEKSGSGNGKYERTEERINNAFDRIHNTIENSPYKINDIGIQVMLEPPDPKDPTSLPQSRVNDIRNILSTMIRTTLPKSGGQLSDQQMSDKISVSVEPFDGRMKAKPKPEPVIPLWAYFAGGGVLLLIILLLILLLLRKRNVQEEEEFEEDLPEQPTVPEPPVKQEKEETIRRRQLEEMAKENPEQFVKLLRSWLSEE